MSTRARILKRKSADVLTSPVNTLDRYFTRRSSTTGEAVSRKRKSSIVDTGKEMFTVQITPGTHTAKRPALRQRNHNQWIPIDEADGDCMVTFCSSPIHASSSSIESIHKSHKNNAALKVRNLFSQHNTQCCRTPLPSLNWGDAQEVWQVMKKKEQIYSRDCNLLRRHPHLQSRMRAILLDWIIEVCEVYRLHRETFYLAVDFIDRYLSAQINIQKSQLQLLGVTCLFIAAKLEEIYPPKIVDFAYVTDGACSEYDISNQELIILKALHWDLTPMTINMWMCVYLQVLNHQDTHKSGTETSLTQTLFSGQAFVQLARMMDLVLLDIGSLQFSYSQLAASVLYHFSNEQSTNKASGYTWEELSACISWMAPFAITVRDSHVVHVKTFENVMLSDCHNIQTHVVSLEMLDSAQRRQREMQKALNHVSPQRRAVPDTILTPPSSNRKPRILR